jgi:hypothetical protein
MIVVHTSSGFLIGIYPFYENGSTETFGEEESALDSLPGGQRAPNPADRL